MDTAINHTEKDNVEPLLFTISISAMPERLDKVLSVLMPDHSRARIQSWIEEGHVLVNSQSVRTRHQVLPGDKLQVWPQSRPEELAYEAENMDIDIVAQSTSWLVINKPAGLVTHPGAGNWTGTLLNGLLYHFPQLKNVARAGIVHRLDKDTSGVMVVALTEQAQIHLVRQLQERTVKREYIALCHGFLYGADSIDLAIGRDARVPVKMSTQHAVAPRTACTHYKAVAQGLTDTHAAITAVECRLETGRTHQIRVHLSAKGHPLLGDTLYGGKTVLDAERQMLHARSLGFDDPETKKRLNFTVDTPTDFNEVYEQVQWKTA